MRATPSNGCATALPSRRELRLAASLPVDSAAAAAPAAGSAIRAAAAQPVLPSRRERRLAQLAQLAAEAPAPGGRAPETPAAETSAAGPSVPEVHLAGPAATDHPLVTMPLSTLPIGQVAPSGPLLSSRDRASMPGRAPRGGTARGARPHGSVTKRTAFASMCAVGMLAVSAALPAAALTTPGASATEAGARASGGDQLYAVGSTVGGQTIQRDGYSVESVQVAQADQNMNRANTFTVNPDGVVLWPFPQGVPLTDAFGYRGGPYAGMHTGQDFAAGEGAAIRAIADGVVVDTNFIPGADGQHVVIQHTVNGQTFRTVSAHMISGSQTVKAGDHVTAGQVIGFVGSTGAATGPHLHLDVIFGDTSNQVFVDPWAFLLTFNAISKDQVASVDFASYLQTATRFSYGGGLITVPGAPVAPSQG